MLVAGDVVVAALVLGDGDHRSADVGRAARGCALPRRSRGAANDGALEPAAEAGHAEYRGEDFGLRESTHMDRTQITWTMPNGSEGVDDDLGNPFSRAVNRLLEDGQPFSRIAFCFCISPGQMPQEASILRWLGCFVLSAGDRVIFFPGLDNAMTGIQGYQGSSLKWDKAFNTDHVSLEKDWTRWHVTSPKSKSHLGGPRTTPLGEGRYLWFGMSIANFSVLRRVRKATVATYPSPPTDSVRRLETFIKARNEAEFLAVSFHPELDVSTTEGFPHFSVIVGPKGFPDYQKDRLAFPDGSPFLKTPFTPGTFRLKISTHRLSLAEQVDIQIITSWLPYGLRCPVSFTAEGAS